MMPNLFIVGAPKCGTTALAQYLSEHPQVFMADPKEPHFFATDLPDHHKVKNEQDYLRLFKRAKTEKIIGEASVWYAYSESALWNIKVFNPNAKLMLMLRKPSELVYSMHSQHLYSRNEHELSFEKAWQLSEERSNGQQIIDTASDGHKVLNYKRIANLGEQLERILKIFPKEQIKWIFFEDFKANTAAVFQDVQAFLDIDDIERTHFPRINSNKRQRYAWLANLTERPPQAITKPYQALKRNLDIQQRFNFLEPLRSLNDVKETREALSLDMQQIIIEHYKKDIIKLSDLTGRDLSHWLNQEELEPKAA